MGLNLPKVKVIDPKKEHDLFMIIRAADNLELVSAELVEFHENTSGRLWGILMKKFRPQMPPRLVDDFDDGYQDGWSNILINRKSFNPEKVKVFPWAVAVCSNAISNLFKKLRNYGRRFESLDDAAEGNSCEIVAYGGKALALSSALDDESRKQTIRIIEDAIHNLLTEDERDVLSMRIYSELGYEKIAANKNIAVSTAHKYFKSACFKLRKYLKTQNITLDDYVGEF